MKKEIWKKFIKWKPDSYPKSTNAIVMVSNFGNVKRLFYIKWNKKNNSYSKMKEHYYKSYENRGKQRFEKNKIIQNGKYQSISIKDKTYYVHRMVVICFLSNKKNKPQVNHLDGNRSNNNIKNLEWCTNKENNKHAKKIGLRPACLYDRLRKLTDKQKKQALQMRLNGKGIVEIGKIFNVSHETIRIHTKDFL